MKLKRKILSIVDRDTLKEVVDDLEIEDVDRRSAEAMDAKLSRTHRATPALLFEYLTEKQVKAVCEEMGVASTGDAVPLSNDCSLTKREKTRSRL